MKQYYCIILLLFSFSFYAQNDTIPVVKKANISVVSTDRMNVVYRGVPNPISIAVNNAKSYTVSGDGVSLQNGKYVLRAGSGKETKVIVEIENFDGSKVIEEHIFRIKGLPKPIGTLNDEYSTQGEALTFTKEDLKNAVVNVKFIDFLFDFNFSVTQFNFSISGKKAILVEGNNFNEQALKIIYSANKKDYLIISNIKTSYMSPDVCHSYPRPISFKVVN